MKMFCKRTGYPYVQWAEKLRFFNVKSINWFPETIIFPALISFSAIKESI